MCLMRISVSVRDIVNNFVPLHRFLLKGKYNKVTVGHYGEI